MLLSLRTQVEALEINSKRIQNIETSIPTGINGAIMKGVYKPDSFEELSNKVYASSRKLHLEYHFDSLEVTRCK